MSLATILESIERDASAEAARVVTDAEAEADRIRAAARAEADRRLAAALAAAEPALVAEAARVVNAARLRLLRRRAEVAAARTEAAWREAGERLAAIAGEGGERWRRALLALTAEALAMAGPGAIVSARPADALLIAAAVAANGGRVQVAGGDAPAGPVVRSADGRLEIDATLNARRAKSRHTLTVG
jgi:vacuolar-type H+-ATPase subunit E/Vma4